MSGLKILIVEDEAIVARELGARLEMLGYSIVGIADNYNDSLELIKEKRPDLLLIDIHLHGEKDGIELANQVKKVKDIPFIYLTSQADAATVERAKHSNPAAYLLKPYNERELQISIDLAISNYSTGKTSVGPDERLNDAEEIYSMKDRIFIKKNNRFVKVRFEDIMWAESQSNYTEIHTAKESYMLALTLGIVEKRLKMPFFVRVHRSFLVNVNWVDSISGNTLYIGNKMLPVSKNNREEVLQYFELL